MLKIILRYISIYELHVRDFSVYDETVEPEHRGGYLAFTLKDSAGVKHLQKLADAGLTHLHLPTYQFGDVDDEKENWKYIDTSVLEGLSPDSAEAQARITEIQNEDGFNWGYNPVLWGVPKGSYASDLMGHIMKDTMVKAKYAIGKLRKETDGVDGSRIYLYGQGWNFGEVANNGRGVNASQFNLTATGIGSFNDRIRDATRIHYRFYCYSSIEYEKPSFLLSIAMMVATLFMFLLVPMLSPMSSSVHLYSLVMRVQVGMFLRQLQMVVVTLTLVVEEEIARQEAAAKKGS